MFEVPAGLDRPCARRRFARAGQDGRMSPGAEQKNGVKAEKREDDLDDRLLGLAIQDHQLRVAEFGRCFHLFEPLLELLLIDFRS